MAIALQRQGVDFLILEKADDDRRHLARQHLSRAARVTSRRTCTRSPSSRSRTGAMLFSQQPEILDYLKGVTDKYGLRRYIRVQLPRRSRALGRRRVPLACVHRGRAGVRRTVPDLRRRRAAHPVAPRHRGLGRIPPVACFPFRAVGPQRRPDRQTGGGHRNRRQRDPDRARDRRTTSAELQLYQRTPPG